MATFSVLLPTVPRRPRQALPYAELVRDHGAARLWQGQGLLAEPHQTFAYLAAAGVRVPTGLGVTLMPLRHPYEAAVQARSVALATGKPLVAGYGPGGKELQRAMLGEPYRRPLTVAREYITIMRRLFTGQMVEFEGEAYSCRAQLAPCPAPRIELGLGVLRPGMARLAGELADVAITWLTPATYLREVVLPAIREGAEAAGRPAPRVAAIVPVALTTDDEDPTPLVLASNQLHLSAPHYRDMLRQAGVTLPDSDLSALAKAALAGGAFVAGGHAEVAEGLRAFFDAGVDEVVLNVTGVRSVRGSAAAERELVRLLEIVPETT